MVLKTCRSSLKKLAKAEQKSLLKWTYKAYQRRTCISLFLGTIMSNCVSLFKRRFIYLVAVGRTEEKGKEK